VTAPSSAAQGRLHRQRQPEKTATDGTHTSSNTVTITVANRVWWVNSAAASNGNGT
jgi:hypothetical protein